MTAVADPVKHAWGEIDADGCKAYHLHAAQSRLMAHPARFKVACAGTGGGKTCLGALWALVQTQRVLAEKGHCEGLVVAPTHPIKARATAPELVRTFRGTDLEGRYTPTQLRYDLPDALGVIWCLSAENPEGLEGGQFDWVWIDEGGQMKYPAWIALQGRIGLHQSPAMITTTPYRFNWLYSEVVQRAASGDEDYHVETWSSIDNPAYPLGEYERAKATLPGWRAAMRYDGQFVRPEGLVYPDLQACVLEHPMHEIPRGVCVGGIDFGYNDPFAALGGVIYRDRRNRHCLYVFYERYKRLQTVAEHAVSLPAGHVWYADPSRPDSIKELRSASHSARKAPNAIQAGIDAVTKLINQDRLQISPSCRALIAEAEEYSFPSKDDQPKGDKPTDEFNHACDALRYLVMGARRHLDAA